MPVNLGNGDSMDDLNDLVAALRNVQLRFENSQNPNVKRGLALLGSLIELIENPRGKAPTGSTKR